MSMSTTVPIEPLSLELEQGYTEAGTEVATVLVTLRSGQTLRLCEGEYITIISTRVPRKAVCILARPKAGVERRRSVTPRIDRPTDPDTEWSYDLYGTVESVDAQLFHGDSETAYRLDVGVGTVLVDSSLDDLLPASDRPVAVGDTLFVPTSRLELYDDHFPES